MGKQTIESGIKVLLVGAGQGGKALLKMFLGDPSITVTGVADIDENAPGLIIAKRENIPTDSDFRNLILDNSMDLIVDVTGDPGVSVTSSFIITNMRNRLERYLEQIRQRKRPVHTN